MREKIEDYIKHLAYEEKSQATRKQYQRDILCFFAYLGNALATKERVIQYKKTLQKTYQPSSVNAKLAAINGFFPLSENLSCVSGN